MLRRERKGSREEDGEEEMREGKKIGELRRWPVMSLFVTLPLFGGVCTQQENSYKSVECDSVPESKSC